MTIPLNSQCMAGSNQPKTAAYILKLNLLENSHSFLSEALAKAVAAEKDSAEWKFAIFNLTQAIELSLKERLSRFHPLLIYQSVDKRKQTVTLKDALSRLRDGCELQLSRIDVDTIESAAEWRNQIVHSGFALNTTELKSAFAKLIGFIADFHKTFLNDQLERVIKEDLWFEAVSIRDYGVELFNRAKERFSHEKIDPMLVLVCPRCGWEAFVIQDDKNTCYVCGCVEDVAVCNGCGKPEYASRMSGLPGSDSGDFASICRRCVDAVNDAWADTQIPTPPP